MLVVTGAVKVRLLVDIACEWLDPTDALKMCCIVDDKPLPDLTLEDACTVELSMVECGIVELTPWELVAEWVDVLG